ncbi:MAG: FMN-binding protein [Pseudomonadales bacterium]
MNMPVTGSQPESLPKTLAITVLIAACCATMVTAAVLTLRPMQAAYAAIERNRAIVAASNPALAEAGDSAIVTAYLALQRHLVDLRTGADIDDVDTVERWPSEADASRPGVPVYLRVRDGKLDCVVLPLDGKGMWSTLYAYLALEGDLATVRALSIYRHEETPGIGDRIQDPAWLAQWHGRRLYDSEGNVRLGEADAVDADFYIDTITGATVTSSAAIRMVRASLDTYQPILQSLATRFPTSRSTPKETAGATPP